VKENITCALSIQCIGLSLQMAVLQVALLFVCPFGPVTVEQRFAAAAAWWNLHKFAGKICLHTVTDILIVSTKGHVGHPVCRSAAHDYWHRCQWRVDSGFQ